jgi:hypothetical protein
MYIALYDKYPLFMSDFKNLNFFFKILEKNMKISNYMKIRRMETELFRADRQTDRKL